MPRAFPQVSHARKRRDAKRRRAQDLRWKAKNGPVVRFSPPGPAPPPLTALQ